MSLVDSVGPELTRSLVAPIGEAAADLWGIAIGDRIATWRLRNVIATHRMLQTEAEAAGLKLNADKIPERFAVAWFETAAREDDQDLQRLFARLLGGVASGQLTPETRLVRKLGELTAADAEVFRDFYSLTEAETKEMIVPDGRDYWVEHVRFSVWRLEHDRPHAGRTDLSIEALDSLGLVRLFEGANYSPRMINRQMRPKVLREDSSIDEKHKAILDHIRDATARSEFILHTSLGHMLADAVLKPLSSAARP